MQSHELKLNELPPQDHRVSLPALTEVQAALDRIPNSYTLSVNEMPSYNHHTHHGHGLQVGKAKPRYITAEEFKRVLGLIVQHLREQGGAQGP